MSKLSVEASIKTEASRNSKIATDIDNFRYRYVDVDNENGIEVKFPSFDVLTFDKNLFILLNASERVKFQNRWYMRPDYVSYDYYNSVIYWPLILYINNVYTIEEFVDFEYILVPPFEMIFQLFSDNKIDKQVLPLQDNDDLTSYINTFYKKYPLDKQELARLAAQDALLETGQDETLSVYNAEKTETITVTSDILTNKYVDLVREPSNFSSISLSLNNLSINQRYNYDYVLKYDGNNSLRRISWKLSDIIESSGNDLLYSSMEKNLRVGTILKIKYGVSIVYRISDGIPNI